MNSNYHTIGKHFVRYDLMFSNSLRAQHRSHRQVLHPVHFCTHRTLFKLAQYERRYVHIFSFSVVDHHQGPQVDGHCPSIIFSSPGVLVTHVILSPNVNVTKSFLSPNVHVTKSFVSPNVHVTKSALPNVRIPMKVSYYVLCIMYYIF